MQAFQCNLLKAKEEEDTKKSGLLDFYHKVYVETRDNENKVVKVDGLLTKIPEKDFSLLEKQPGDIKKIMKLHVDQLTKEKKFLLVTGKCTRENRH